MPWRSSTRSSATSPAIWSAPARRAREAARDGADIIAFSELFIAGYPPEDLVLKPAFQAACRAAVEALARETADGGPAVLIGTPWVEDGKLYNAYALLAGGRIEAIRFKVNLPNYGVFDEKRVFAAGPLPGPVNFRGVRLGLPVCEDTWTDWGDYENVVECLAETGAEILVVPNGSPYWRDKADVRLNVAVARVTESGLPLIYVNQVGGQDELVFDGASFALNADRSIAFQLPAFREVVVTTHWSRIDGAWRCAQGPIAPAEEAGQGRLHRLRAGPARLCRQERLQGRRARPVRRHRFGAVRGDGDRCARRRARALRDAAVSATRRRNRSTMPPRSPARSACATTSCRSRAPCSGLEAALAGVFAGAPRDVTEENLQARARGTILMAISNKFGLMVVTTGNKSEMSVGYATLYGDMNGGFNPIKDLYKTEVYRLARLRNALEAGRRARSRRRRSFRKTCITRAPSAELRENQTDQDTLPPYDVLDQILERLVEREEPTATIVAAGFDRDTVMKVERMLYLAEYKRRQAAPGVKVTLKNFGRDRRYPIVNRFRDPGTPLPEPDRTRRQGCGHGESGRGRIFDAPFALRGQRDGGCDCCCNCCCICI